MFVVLRPYIVVQVALCINYMTVYAGMLHVFKFKGHNIVQGDEAELAKKIATLKWHGKEMEVYIMYLHV